MTSRNPAPDRLWRPICSPVVCPPHISPHSPSHEWEDREVSSEGPAPGPPGGLCSHSGFVGKSAVMD